MSLPKLTIQNDSSYPNPIVRKLVKFGLDETDTRGLHAYVEDGKWGVSGNARPIGLDTLRVRTRGKRAGTFISYREPPERAQVPRGARYFIHLRIGSPGYFPTEGKYRGTESKNFPLVSHLTWQEGLVGIAAHEGRHIDQFREGLPLSEVRCEYHEKKMVERFRQEGLPGQEQNQCSCGAPALIKWTLGEQQGYACYDCASAVWPRLI